MSENYHDLLRSIKGSNLSPEVLDKLNALSLDHRDILTGMFDYRSFCHHAGKKLKENENSILMAISIDYLYELNLLRGRVIGDIIICQCGSLIEHMLKPDLICGRPGGQVFMILIPGHDETLARRLFRGLRKTMMDLNVPGSELLPDKKITLSGGIYHTKKDDSIETAMTEVENRLKYAKRCDGNRLALVDSNAAINASKIQTSINIILNYDEISIRTELLSLSPRFITVKANRLLRLGKIINITICFDENLDHSTTVEVVWRKKSSDGHYQLGLSFDSSSASLVQAIETTIAMRK